MAQYDVITFDEAVKYKKKIDIDKPLLEISFNKASVYKVLKERFLIVPNGIFSNHLLVTDLKLITDFSAKKYFPDNGEIEKLWYPFKDADTTLTFKAYYKILSAELAKVADITAFENPDTLYETLKKKRKQKAYSKQFLFVLGVYLVKKSKRIYLKLAMVQRFVYLNPIYSIVLMDTRDNSFYDYEYKVYGKWGYVGTDYILRSIKQFGFGSLEMWNCRLVYIYE